MTIFISLMVSSTPEHYFQYKCAIALATCIPIPSGDLALRLKCVKIPQNSFSSEVDSLSGIAGSRTWYQLSITSF